MKLDKLVSQLIAAFLSFVIAMAGLVCLVTAFGFAPESWQNIALWCGGAAVLAVVFFRFRWGSLVLTSLGLLLLNVLLRTTRLLGSVELVLNSITRLYDQGYHWGYIRWSEGSLLLYSCDGALILLGCLVIFSLCWTLLRKRPLVFAVLGSLMPLLPCCLLLDTVPSESALLVLLSGIALVLLSRSTSRSNDGRANRIVACMLIPVVLFSCLLFLWAPAVPYEEPAGKVLSWFLAQITPDPKPGPGGPVDPSAGTDGPNIVGPILDLTRIGPRKLSSQSVMQVTTDYRGILYLRDQAYDTYTGTDWRAELDTAGEGGWPENLVSGGDFITIDTFSAKNHLYVPYYIASQGWSKQLQHGLLPNPNGDARYSFQLLTTEAGAAYAPLSQQELQAYCALPEDTLAALKPYLAQILTGVMTTAQRAAAIADFVRTSAVYDLNTQPMPSDSSDFALWFLENSETGYCVHFASAATVLLRAADIPARYVTGYMAPADADGTTIIIARQAHSWVEYLDPDRGWTVLEATPSLEPEPTEPPTDPSTEPGTQPPTEPTPTQPEDTNPPTRPPQTLPQNPTQGNPGVSAKPRDWTWLKVLLWLVLFWAVIAGQYHLRLRLRQYWLRRGDANRQAVRRWRYIRRFSRLSSIRAPKELYRLTEKAVFSQHTLTEAELGLYDGWIADAHRQLLEKHRPWKLILKLLLAIE